MIYRPKSRSQSLSPFKKFPKNINSSSLGYFFLPMSCLFFQSFFLDVSFLEYEDGIYQGTHNKYKKSGFGIFYSDDDLFYIGMFFIIFFF